MVILGSILSQPLDPAIDKALRFIESKLAKDDGLEYWEVAEEDDREHFVYNQTQYLLSVMFKSIGRQDLFEKIRKKHHPDEPDNDPTKGKNRIASDRWCVLDGETKRFYLLNEKSVQGKGNDEFVLVALHWLLRKEHASKLDPRRWDYDRKAKRWFDTVKSRYDPSKGVLEMDKADIGKGTYSVYKVALLGILANRMKDTATLNSVRTFLRNWQDEGIGGWQTERTEDLKAGGLINAETTALVILALLD
jgi:hypothetical protein